MNQRTLLSRQPTSIRLTEVQGLKGRRLQLLKTRSFGGVRFICNWDEEEQMFMPDVVVTVVYEADADRTEYIYFEQDGMTATLYNWLNGRLSISQTEALKCEIIVPEDGE